MNMYSSLESEFSQPMQNVGLDFKNEYLKALKSFDGYNFDVDERHQAIKGVLQRILDRYSETPAKTKGGRVARVIAKILSFIIPYFKAKKMKAKITSLGLNLRQQPTTESNVVTILKKSWVLDVIGPDVNGWTKVKYGIYNGFVSSKFIELIPDVVPHTLTLAERALNVAVYQLGNAEIPHGSNWGKHVEKYLKSVGINVPSPWCMAFTYWCVNEACKEMDLNNPLKKTGGVMAQWVASKHLRVDKPMKGDIFIMDFGGGKGHTGFVTSVVGDRIQTVEGNSNDEGSREGFEVCRKPGGRAISSCKGFLRLVNN